jgi:hypothetical protein
MAPPILLHAFGAQRSDDVNAEAEPVAAERPAAQSTFDVILLNGITVRVPSQFDAVALRRVVDVMSGASDYHSYAFST